MAYWEKVHLSADYQWTFGASEELLFRMGLEIRHSDLRTGRLLCHSEASKGGANGYFEVHVVKRPVGVEVVVQADSYSIFSKAKFRQMIDWFLQTLIGWERMGAPAPQPMPPGPPFERPSRAGPVLLTSICVGVFLGLGWFGIARSDSELSSILLLLAFMSPFIVAMALFLVRQYRIGGVICIIFGFFAGLLFGFFGWILIIIFAELGGHMAMENGRWEHYYNLVIKEAGEVPRDLSI